MQRETVLMEALFGVAVTFVLGFGIMDICGEFLEHLGKHP